MIMASKSASQPIESWSDLEEISVMLFNFEARTCKRTFCEGLGKHGIICVHSKLVLIVLFPK